MNIEVILSPAEFDPLSRRDLSSTTCVVFDVLRATSSMITALNNGAEAIIPVSEIPEALALHDQHQDYLLAGERNGLRLGREQTGSVDFNFGNSPREFTADKVAGKTIVWTTTNGTRAMRSCAHAEMILVGSLLNLRAVADVIDQLRPRELVIVCAGTFEQVAYEDVFAAGALIERLRHHCDNENLTDSAHIAHATFLKAGSVDPVRALARNARKLQSLPDLAGDIHICLDRNVIKLNAALMSDGSVRALEGFAARLA
ncbi:MAG TPA: 2-phosphosulfolactate phosphatase [Candidatus Acidoferrum sp.]|nr:2-phosphosulfolactate phosphatase [Candidatus Acidoferrum sp.]